MRTRSPIIQQHYLIGALAGLLALACGDSSPSMKAVPTPAVTTASAGDAPVGAAGPFLPTDSGTEGSPAPADASGPAAAETAMPTTPSATPEPGPADAGPTDMPLPAMDAGSMAQGDVPSEPQGTGPGDWSAGDYPPNLMAEEYLEISGVAGQNGMARQYKVHVPPGYDPNTPTPAVFCIHGLGQTPVLFCLTGAQMHTKSDEAGFILIMPNGHLNSWNGGVCCGAAAADHLDDVALFRAIFAEVGEHLNIDLARVYATGLSNGGFMSYRLACEAADLFAAVAPGAGLIGLAGVAAGTNADSDFKECKPSRPVPILDTHGSMDGLIPFALKPDSLELIRTQYGCQPEPKPSVVPASGGDTTCVSYEGCMDGTELTACTVEGGGHCWFGSPDCGTGAGDLGKGIVGADSDTLDNTREVWEFFERVAK